MYINKYVLEQGEVSEGMYIGDVVRVGEYPKVKRAMDRRIKLRVWRYK